MVEEFWLEILLQGRRNIPNGRKNTSTQSQKLESPENPILLVYAVALLLQFARRKLQLGTEYLTIDPRLQQILFRTF